MKFELCRDEESRFGEMTQIISRHAHVSAGFHRSFTLLFAARCFMTFHNFWNKNTRSSAAREADSVTDLEKPC